MAIHTSIHMSRLMSINMSTHVCILVCTLVCTQAYTHAYAHVGTLDCAHVYTLSTRMFVHMYVHVFVRMSVHMSSHMSIHRWPTITKQEHWAVHHDSKFYLETLHWTMILVMLSNGPLGVPSCLLALAMHLHPLMRTRTRARTHTYTSVCADMHVLCGMHSCTLTCAHVQAMNAVASVGSTKK